MPGCTWWPAGRHMIAPAPNAVLGPNHVLSTTCKDRLLIQPHLVILQDDLSLAHLAEELQELAVLHLGGSVLGEVLGQGLGLRQCGCMVLLLVGLAQAGGGACLGAAKLLCPPLALLRRKVLHPALPWGGSSLQCTSVVESSSALARAQTRLPCLCAGLHSTAPREQGTAMHDESAAACTNNERASLMWRLKPLYLQPKVFCCLKLAVSAFLRDEGCTQRYPNCRQEVQQSWHLVELGCPGVGRVVLALLCQAEACKLRRPAILWPM